VDFLRRIHERNGSTNTYEHYRQILVCFFTEPALMPDHYARSHVEAFLRSPGQAKGRKGRPPGSGLMNNRLSVLNSFYKYAANYGITDASGAITPLMHTMFPTAGLRHMQRPRPPYRALSAEELRRFFAAIGTGSVRALRDRALFLMYFWCARRRSEILALRRMDIEEGIIIEGNTRHAGMLYHFKGKGKKQIDDMQELPPQAASAVFAYLRASGKLNTMRPDDPIFTALPDHVGKEGYDPRRPLSAQCVWRACKVYAAKAGLDPSRVTVHSFRHSAVRARYESGSDIRAIQKLLRHSNLSTTSDYLQSLTGTSDPGYLLLEKEFGDL
jgi:integrase